MNYLIFITAVLCIFAFYLHKKYEHPACLFLITWLFIFLLYNIQLFRINELSDQQFWILFIMVTGFFIGTIIYDAIIGNKYHKHLEYAFSEDFEGTNDNEQNATQLRELLFWCFCLISIVVMLVDQIQIIISLLGGSSFRDIMAAADGKHTVEYSGSVQVALYLFIVHPMSVCSIPICAVEFFRRTEKRWRYIILNLVMVSLAVVHHGGRNSIIVFAICYLITFTLMGKKIQISKRVKKIFAALICILGFFIISITASRGIEDTWLSFYAYFICCIPLSQIYLGYSFVAANKTYGFFSLRGFFYPLYALLSKFGIGYPTDYTKAVTIANIVEDNYVSIGDYHSTGTNAFLPAGTYFYIDGGYFFEILGMIVYGFICAYTYRLQERTGEAKHTALYILIAYGLVLSFARLYFSSYHYALSLIYILFLFYKRPNRRKRVIIKIGDRK
ncbi:MAG: oligosaccharide repeat unit polymerase [Odoribacter sp.]|nr:oligosaccharide repeat unit polymerase [Odoribacter sp.]